MGTSTMSGHYVCHLKKEGRWVGLGEFHKDEKMFSWKRALVQNRACIHGRQNMHAVTVYTFPTTEVKIVTDRSCDEPVLIPLRSMLKCFIGFPVLAGSNLCLCWGISSVSGFVYLSFPQLLFHINKLIKLWVTLIFTVVLILAMILMYSHCLALRIPDFSFVWAVTTCSSAHFSSWLSQ